MSRVEVFSPDEIAIVHVMNRTVRRCYLMGQDPLTGHNYDHRKGWMETELKRLAAYFGIDLLCYAVLSNHFHLVLRSRPDIVESWSDTQVAQRWLMLCPKRKDKFRRALEPTPAELNRILNNRKQLARIRLRLSDISWWMRLLSQTIAQRANKEDEEVGKFWQARYKAVRLLDEASLVACSAYVDLNPIRAAIAESLETSAYTSIQQRIEQLKRSVGLGQAPAKGVLSGVVGSQTAPGTDRSNAVARNSAVGSNSAVASNSEGADGRASDAAPSPVAIEWWQAGPGEHLSPLGIDERHDELGAHPSQGPRASDKGYLPMTTGAYIELLEWTGRQVRADKRGVIPASLGPIFERLGISQEVWLELVKDFGRLFYTVAGKPKKIDETRSKKRKHRYKALARTRQLMAGCE
jgi:hypothetical protein